MSLFVQQNGSIPNGTDENAASTSSTPKPRPSSSASITNTSVELGAGIREVWASNLEEEFRLMRQIIQKYPFVSLDTEFPGVVMKPLGEFETQGDYQYQKMKLNVDSLKLIQVGFTFMDENGNVPTDYSTWQFNFKFSIHDDMFAQGSVDLLYRSGIQFNRMPDDGIAPENFAELLMTSGLVLCDSVTWLSFHSAYDFGYLMKCLMNDHLPQKEEEFFDLAKLFFPKIYDIKVLVGFASQYRGGLQELSQQLQVDRVGAQHQAGSDSLVTGHTFFKIKETYFKNEWTELGKYEGIIFGLGSVYPPGTQIYPSGGSPVPFPKDQTAIDNFRIQFGQITNPTQAARDNSASADNSGNTNPSSINVAGGAERKKWEREGSGSSSSDTGSSTTPESVVSNGDPASGSQ